MDNACQYCTIVGARHNVDPPVANPLMTTTLYKNLYFYSLLHGKFKTLLFSNLSAKLKAHLP